MIELDTSDLEAALEQLALVPERAAARLTQVEQEALGHLILGAQANIYSTTPGAYQRTLAYMRSLSTSSRATKNTLSVWTRSSSPYAQYIERGRGGMSFPQLQQLAAMSGNPEQPLTLGRSGQQWWISGPVVTGAQYFALWRLGQVFGEEMRRSVPP